MLTSLTEIQWEVQHLAVWMKNTNASVTKLNEHLAMKEVNLSYAVKAQIYQLSASDVVFNIF